jgi:endonuclease/exonuclease/phosphatase (EEP) superfamily protein YafD
MSLRAAVAAFVALAAVAAISTVVLRRARRAEAPEAPSASGEAPLTIASYNVLYELTRKKEGTDPEKWVDRSTLRHIQKLDADVIVFQETNETWEAAIRAVLSARFPHCAFHVSKRHLPGGLGACSKRPLVANEILSSPVGWFPAQRIVVQAEGGSVQILNLHLRPALSGPGRDGDTWGSANLATRAIRKKEIEAYLRHLEPRVPTIIAGDFNELGAGDLFRVLTAAGYENALTRAGERGSTWRWLSRPEALNAQIDHVAYRTSAFELASAKIVKGGRSDHFPIVVALRRRGRHDRGASGPARR